MDQLNRRQIHLVVSQGGLYIYYVTHLEEVPYTHRKHFIAISPATERALGEQQFQQVRRTGNEKRGRNEVFDQWLPRSRDSKRIFGFECRLLEESVSVC